MGDTPGEKPLVAKEKAPNIAADINQLRAAQEVPVSTLNIGNIDQVAPTSIINPTPPNFIALKDGIDLKTAVFTPNTISDPLFLRSRSGEQLGSAPQNATLKPTGNFVVFKPQDAPRTSILMLEVEFNGITGFAAAPYLKLNSTAPAEPVATVSANFEEPVTVSELAAKSPQELLVVGDSITEGIALTSPKFRVDSKRGRTSGQNLSRLQELFSTNQFPPNLKSVALYIGVNDLVSGNPAAVATATRNLLGAISFLKEKGIQPVVSTLFLSSSNLSGNPDQDPLAKNIQRFNEEVKALAIKEGIPLINFAAIANPSNKIHPGRAVYSQMTDLINQAIS